MIFVLADKTISRLAEFYNLLLEKSSYKNHTEFMPSK
jgi:hypothetical protein